MESGLGLGGAYGAMVRRIEAQGGERARLGMAVLMWISHSRRPLPVDALCYAISIRIGSKDLDNDGILPISTWLSYCQGLVTVDKGAATVRLIHFSLQEYLGTHPQLFDKAHSTMAETCLTYLNFQNVKDLSADSPPDPRDTPFLEYSSLYWGTHMRMEHSDRAKTLALQLLGEWDGHISVKSLWKSAVTGLPDYYDIPRRHDKPFPALHCVSYFGIAEVADTLIQTNRWDVNQRGDGGMTPLIWAASCGHEKVVELLFQQEDIQPDMRDENQGRTALLWAARNGHEAVVKLFLEPQFVNPGRIGRLWGAPQVVGKLFNKRYVNPDARDRWYGKTPLWWAVWSGHEGIVKLLLARKDVNPNSSSKSCETPLRSAARSGHEGIVKLLLARKDVNPDSSSKSGRTPLWSAAKEGHEGIVKLLLARKDVNPNSSSNYDGTPLWSAAKEGHEGIVKLLLARKDVNPNSSCKYGRTPLSRAAEKGHEGIVKLLLGRKEVNPDTPDTRYGRTSLSWAAENGHEGIVKLLLDRKEVNPDTPDTWHRRTPLSSAAGNGHEGIVKLLLDRKEVNPDTPDTWYGRTPLSSAAGNGHEGIVKLLLGRKEVNPDTPDTLSGQTPLSWAAENGHEGIVKLLLGRKEVNPNGSNKSGRTPLEWASENGHEGIVKLLLEAERCEPQ